MKCYKCWMLDVKDREIKQKDALIESTRMVESRQKCSFVNGLWRAR